jgi:dTDP-4-dehydrorhamnose reductase/UDP-glucose 4-epimerase
MPGGRVLLVGHHSFLAQHALGALAEMRVVAVGHEAIDQPGLMDGVGCVINFARHPLAGSDAYRLETMDADLRLARRIGRENIAYVMLSSRKVYAPATEPLSETSATGPGLYGRHKLAVEHALRDLLGSRLTVLRLANIFGYERTPGRRTFMALCLDRLAREGRIHYGVSPFVKRDFLPADAFARVLARIAAAPPGGVLNLGSGIALPTGRLALWILEGFGSGSLVIGSTEEKDPFVLDIGRLTDLYGAPCTRADLRDACVAIGRRLATERAQSSR